MCGLCNGAGKLNKHKRETRVQDCIYDIWIKCKEKSIPLKVLLDSIGSLILKQTDKNVNQPSL